MAKIIIGADELILWLRKNTKAKDTPNDEVQGLGRRIYELIVDRSEGVKKYDIPSYWANHDGDKNIGKYELPKTSMQYEIDTSKLGSIFNELNKW